MCLENRGLPGILGCTAYWTPNLGFSDICLIALGVTGRFRPGPCNRPRGLRGCGRVAGKSSDYPSVGCEVRMELESM